MNYSPLRYPGGKNKISAFIAKICLDNKVSGHYVEPYCGGAAVALFLLMEGFVEKITINDKDRSIYAFWHSLLNQTSKLCELIENTEVTIKEWQKQHDIQQNKAKVDLLTLGFSTFFLNRTNRSGILNARPIGGLNQDGEYKMDCRYNKVDLINRIKAIAKEKKNIRLYRKDALRLIDKIENESNLENTLFYFDPPYYLKGTSLYLNHYKTQNHKAVSERIKAIKNVKWIVSYDNVPEISSLYEGYTQKEYELVHSSNESKVGKEILFFSPNIERPRFNNWNPLKFKIRRKENSNYLVYDQGQVIDGIRFLKASQIRLLV
ncbi:DNA adenine methylase [Robiginitalea biformata]|uniref:site-specific DNA-methyltransferase (adenine-specific) n=1 Tax=Robiginitalea biformata (strain ATCC BAA-864 / DSM 15991 / KCTC 12146 / HTCC2501) TaxID=313596 RepID=A4CGM6_ROBBH|nr:DNA adenine methylase [Robiginitalea biformata]EAR16084.1 DNA-methyltransferase [Robiginitalea biformata HTCC2501]